MKWSYNLAQQCVDMSIVCGAEQSEQSGDAEQTLDPEVADAADPLFFPDPEPEVPPAELPPPVPNLPPPPPQSLFEGHVEIGNDLTIMVQSNLKRGECGIVTDIVTVIYYVIIYCYVTPV